MMQLVPQTHEQKLAMYMKLTKNELAEMLIGCNDALAATMRSVECFQNPMKTVVTNNWTGGLQVVPNPWI